MRLLLTSWRGSWSRRAISDGTRRHQASLTASAPSFGKLRLGDMWKKNMLGFKGLRNNTKTQNVGTRSLEGHLVRHICKISETFV